MPKNTDHFSRSLDLFDRSIEPYKDMDTIANFASALTPLTDNPLWQHDFGSLAASADRFAVQNASALHNLDAGSQFSANFEQQGILSRYDEIVQATQAVSLHTNLTEIVGLMGNLTPSSGMVWFRNSGLQEALEHNHVLESQIARTWDMTQTAFANMDRNQGMVDHISSTLMGLSGLLQTASSGRTVIADICKMVPDTLSVWESVHQIDTDLLYDVADQVLSRNQDWTLDAAVAEISEEYDRAKSKTYHADAKDDVNDAGVVSEKNHGQINPEKVRDWIVAIVAILEFMFGLFAATGNININVNHSFNTVNQTNYYYVMEKHADAKLLNSCCYRIMNRTTMVRRRRDCHSAVVGTLHEGQVVMVIDKHRKWIKVEWEDEEGTLCEGWMQNYKVSAFVP